MIFNIKYSTAFSEIVNDKIFDDKSEKEKEFVSPNAELNVGQEEQNRVNVKDGVQSLQLIEILRLEKEEDYNVRMSQIIETFQLQPINLNLSQEFKQRMIKSIVFQNQELIKQTDILIMKKYEVICYKSKLFEASEIIIKKYSPSNFENDFFDYVVFSHKGEVLCTFHNFKKIERLVKAVLMRFRRLEKIIYVENIVNNEIIMDSFLEIKTLLNEKVKIICVYENSGVDENLKRKAEDTKEEESLNNFSMNELEFEAFCAVNSIIYLSNLNNTKKENFKKDFTQICEIITQKEKFERLILEHICYGNKRNQKFKAKNEITIRLINYCHQKIIESERKLSEITITDVKQEFEKLIKEVETLRLKLKKSKEENNSNLIYKHFPRLMKRGARLCFHCKQKSKYLCIGCSVRHSAKIALCVLCFAPFHESENYTKHFPSIIKKANSKFIPNLEKEVASEILPPNIFTSKSKKNIEISENKIEKDEIKNKSDQINEIEPEKKKECEGPLSKYLQMKSFVFFCYKKLTPEKINDK